MNTTFRKLFTAVTLLLVLSFSAFVTIPVYADESTPEAPVSEETVEVTEPTSPVEEAPQADVETESATETSDSAETVEAILESLPEDTQLVVLDEQGEALPLVTEEAEQTIIVGDPIWCPASVATPTPNLNGCSGSYGTFAALLADPIFAGGGPASDGIIWIEKTYSGEGTTITISGGTFTVMKDFKLTLKGGWNGLGTNTIDTTDKSVFNAPLIITGWANDVTLSDIAVQGSGVATSNVLQVTTTGNITVNRVSVTNNTDGGTFFANSGASTAKNVTVTDSTFSNNIETGTVGLQILSKGVVTLKNVTANSNGSGTFGDGIQIANNFATTAQAVNLTNVSVSNNRGTGILVNSNGVITITDMTAINNGLGSTFGYGADINNNASGFSSGVTLTGTNLFFSNLQGGLLITSNGTVKANNLHANDNNGFGVFIDNDGAATPQSVTITGSNTFKFNASFGLLIHSTGQITTNNLIANFNGNVGVFLDNSTGASTSGVTMTGTNQFDSTMGGSNGLTIFSAGAVTLTNLSANYNSGKGVYIENTASTTFKGVTITGVNTFTNNTENGLDIHSDGVITLNNLTANNNHGFYGVLIDNTTSGATTPKVVTINGTNTIFNNDRHGLNIITYGAVTLNNISATGNGFPDFQGYGASIANDIATVPANVTLNGTNNFSNNYDTGLSIYTKGNIKINNLTSENSQTDKGVVLNNSVLGAVGNVTLTGTNKLSGNQATNLEIFSLGIVSISNLTADNSNNGYGVYIENQTASSSKSVTLSGTNSISNNFYTGLYIDSKGAITINNLNASGNGTGLSGFGAEIDNTLATTPQNVTLTGSNTFSNNYTGGISIVTKGNIKINNLIASNNTSGSAIGASLNTSFGTNGTVSLTGTNIFNNNNGDNLQIFAKGAITINNITANNSVNGYGVFIENHYDNTAPKPVTLTGTNTFNNNYNRGLSIQSFGVITTNNINASANAVSINGYGVYLINSGALSTKPAAVIIKGTNVISGNGNINLYVLSLGAITANSIISNASVNSAGVVFDNTLGSANVTLTGTNSFNGNAGSGLTIVSKGSIIVTNLTSTNNGGYSGIHLDNINSTNASPKPVTINGYATVTGNTSPYGLLIETFGAITTNNLTITNNNTGFYASQQPGSAITITNMIMNGTNKFTNNANGGFSLQTKGSITMNNVTASQNFVGGSISTNFANAIGNVTLNGTNTFFDNTANGLQITAAGTITINSINASENGSFGVEISNTFLGFTMPKAVKITGTNNFNNNSLAGLNITTNGAVTLSNITANGNNSTGIHINGSSADNNTAHVTITGKNQISNNTAINLYVATKGNITVSNLTASYSNSGQGAYLYNDYVGTIASVTVSGTNSFVDNNSGGLTIFSNGAITMTKITADGNGGTGIIADTDAATITLTCASAINNAGYGVTMTTSSIGKLIGLVAAGNTFGNTFLAGGTYTQVYGCPLP